MYEAGCWALPFFACACVLLADAALQLVCIGRRAHGELATTGKKAPPMAILSKLTPPAAMKVLFDGVAWVHMAGLEVTLQPFFGEAPYHQTPGGAPPAPRAPLRQMPAAFPNSLQPCTPPAAIRPPSPARAVRRLFGYCPAQRLATCCYV